jgi:hypothetical protein
VAFLLIQGKIPNVPQFLNRLVSLKTDRQNQVFELFEHRLVEAVHVHYKRFLATTNSSVLDPDDIGQSSSSCSDRSSMQPSK